MKETFWENLWLEFQLRFLAFWGLLILTFTFLGAAIVAIFWPIRVWKIVGRHTLKFFKEIEGDLNEMPDNFD